MKESAASPLSLSVCLCLQQAIVVLSIPFFSSSSDTRCSSIRSAREERRGERARMRVGNVVCTRDSRTQSRALTQSSTDAGSRCALTFASSSSLLGICNSSSVVHALHLHTCTRFPGTDIETQARTHVHRHAVTFSVSSSFQPVSVAANNRGGEQGPNKD